jgi:hypothetical protein
MDDKNIRIISFSRAKEVYDETHCKHLHIEINPVLWQIKCADCGKLIDPIGWFIDQAEQESLMRFNLEQIRKERDEVIKELDNKNRCKCEYFGRMTHIIK